MNSKRAFTVLELMIVIGIIGFMAALALPHLKGFTQGSSMTTATRQLLDDVALARQRAMANHAEVDLVFLPASFWMTNGAPIAPTAILQTSNQIVNLLNHQCSAYALIAQRSVGDQPGKAYVHYLTDWRVLPQGTVISPWLLTTNPSTSHYVSVTNTITSLINSWTVQSFPMRNVPFPSTYSSVVDLLPYIGFAANGQLTTNGDQFILMDSGSFIVPVGAGGPAFLAPTPIETPLGNSTNNPNIIHLDWLTGRAKLERNQF